MSQAEDNPKPKKRRFAPPPQILDDAAARAMRELQERGEWHLEGKGKPLRALGRFVASGGDERQTAS